MTDPNPPNREQDRAWDRTVDLLIIGSGAGAMTAGIVGSDRGAQVLLIEKGTRFGGSSAMSAGGLWVPCNPIARDEGIADDPESAWKYLKGCVREGASDERLLAYLENAPKLVATLRDRTHVDFVPLKDYPDYYPRVEGSMPGGRSLDCTASVMGRSYPGPGATLGPATTFGMVAAEHAIQLPTEASLTRS